MEIRSESFEITIRRHDQVLQPKAQKEWKVTGLNSEGEEVRGWVENPNQYWTDRNEEIFSARVTELLLESVVAAIFPGVRFLDRELPSDGYLDGKEQP